MWGLCGAAALVIVGMLVAGCGSSGSPPAMSLLASPPPTSSAPTVPTTTWQAVNTTPHPVPPLANSVACGSCEGPTLTSDEIDESFLTQARSLGYLSASFPFPDSAAVTGAQTVCNIIALGEAPAIQDTDLRNMRANRMEAYGLTEDQARGLMVLSADTYCATLGGAVDRAFG